MGKEINSKSIEEVLDKMNASQGSGNEKVTEQPSPDAEGLVFEYHKNDEPSPEPEVTAEAEQPEVEENETTSDAAAPAEEAVVENEENNDENNESSESGEESADNNEAPVESEAPAVQEPAPDHPSRVWSTYVPRFTEVSETYRIKGDPRLRAKLKDKLEPESKTEEEKNDDIDPTAEFEENMEEIPATVPERKVAEEKIETINIFKFTAEEDFVEEINGRTAEDEAKEVEELLKREEPKVEETVEEPTADESEEVVAEESTEEPILADPDHEDIKVYDYSAKAAPAEDSPEGVESSVASTRDRKGKIKDSEFTNPVQRDGFKDRFLDSMMSIKIRIGASVVFAVALLALEILTAVGVISFGLFPSAPVFFTTALVDYLFSACIFILTVPEIVRAAKYLGGKKFLPDLLPFVGFVVMTLFTLTVVLTGAESYPLFGFLFAIMSISAISASLYRTKADFLAFRVVSQNEEKQILDKKMTRELPAENMALDGVVDEYKSQIIRTFRTSFVSDFFKNSADVSSVPSKSLVILCVTLSIGLIAGLITLFLAKSVLAAVTVLTLSYLLGSPVFSILSNKLSFFHSQRAAVLEESAAIGEGAFYDFSSADVVAFEDTDIFGPEDVNLKRFMLYGDRDNMEKAMRQMCALFSVVGGPLDFMFANAIDNRVRHKSATNTVIEDDGISGDVMGHRISAGSRDYMFRNGVAIPDASKEAEMGIDTTKILYAAEDGEVYAKFYIRYSFSEEFTSILPALKEEGIIPLVYTRDPNISNELLNTLTTGADSMRVVKMYTPAAASADKVYSRVSANMVTYGDKLNAISMILLSRKYRGFAERLRFTETCAMAVGLMLSVIFAFVGVSGATVLIAALWQIVWSIALQYMSKNAFMKESRKKDDEE